MNFYFLKRKEPTCEIQESTTNNNELFDESFNELLFKLSKTKSQKKNKMSNTVNMIDKYKEFYMMKMLNIDTDDVYSILSNEIDDKFFIVKLTDYLKQIEFMGKTNNLILINPIVKYKNIFYTIISSELHLKLEKLKSNQKFKSIYLNKLLIILKLYDFLEKDGNFIISFQELQNMSDYCDIINIYYILSYMFDYCLIYSLNSLNSTNSQIIIAKKFNPVLTKKDLETLIKQNCQISPKCDLDQVKKFIVDSIKFKLKLNESIEKEKYDTFYNNFLIYSLPELKYFNVTIPDFDYHNTIVENLKISDENKLYNQIGNYIQNLISEYKLYDCLQIGLTNGIYAYYILKNPNTNLLSIDPNQNSKWENKGIELLKKFEMQNKYTFSNKNYYEILPSIVKKKIAKYNFILIEGNTLLNYMLNNFFYCNLLLQVGGFVIITNRYCEGVIDFIQFIENNYKIYKKIAVFENFIVFKKILQDKREFFINYYETSNSENIKQAMNVIEKYDLTDDYVYMTKEYDWLLKNRNKNTYKRKYEEKSWKRTALEILTNPNYKPNFQILNKNIEYVGDKGKINTLDAEFPEQILCEKYILGDDCVLEIGARYGTVSNMINIKLDIKTNQVSLDADLSIKKYLKNNRKQYAHLVNKTNTKKIYHLFFGMLDNTSTTFFLKKMNETYGNVVVSLDLLKDNDIVTTIEKDIMFGEIKNDEEKINKYKLNKIKYEEIKPTFNLTKPINALVLDCEGCGLIIIKQILNLNMLNDIDIVLIEMDYPNSCDYSVFDKILTSNGFILHVCVWYNAVYLKESRLEKYKKINSKYFDDEWWNGMIDINKSIGIHHKYNKSTK